MRLKFLSVRPKRLGFCGSGYVKLTRWRQIESFGGVEFDFWFGTYVDVRKWLRVLEHITKHMKQEAH